MRRHLHDRHRHRNPRIDRGQQKRLGPAARGAGGADAVGIDVGERGQKIDATDTVPQLQRQRSGVLVLPADVAQFPVAHHVVGQDDRAHARQRRGPLLHVGPIAAVVPGLVPVAMRAQDPGVGSVARGRAIQAARHEHAGEALERHLLDGVPVVLAPVMVDGVERCPFRPRAHPSADQDALADPRGARVPLRRASRTSRPDEPARPALPLPCGSILAATGGPDRPRPAPVPARFPRTPRAGGPDRARVRPECVSACAYRASSVCVPPPKLAIQGAILRCRENGQIIAVCPPGPGRVTVTVVVRCTLDFPLEA